MRWICPIYAKSTTPNGPYKNGPGEINVPVVIGGRVVRPGDILVGDQDGLIVIPPEQAQEVLEKTRATMEKGGQNHGGYFDQGHLHPPMGG